MSAGETSNASTVAAARGIAPCTSISSIRDKYQQRFVAKYGEPEEIMRREILRGRVRKDEKAEDFFEEAPL